MNRRALVSVSDKRGVVELAGVLTSLGFEILSTGGTASALAAAGSKVTQVSAYTGAPEILDGRVKTLHPRIHSGLLARRDDAAHMATDAAAIAPLYEWHADFLRLIERLDPRGAFRNAWLEHHLLTS